MLNGLGSNYESDLFTPLFAHIHAFCRQRGLADPPAFREGHPSAYTYKVLADHTRSIAFAICDGLLPSRNGLGGFLKHLVLKSLALCRHELHLGEDACTLLCELVPVLAATFHGHYPELAARSLHIQQVIRSTEQRQADKERLWQQVAERFWTKLGSPASLSGEQVWRLFKGDGSGDEVSAEFIGEFCRQRQVSADMAAYERILLSENEKALSRVKTARKDNSAFIDMAAQLRRRSVPATDHSPTLRFRMDAGSAKAEYAGGRLQARLLAIGVKGPDAKLRLVESVAAGEQAVLVLDTTSFYAESGGQAADEGRLVFDQEGCALQVSDVQHVQDYTFHCGQVSGAVRVGDAVWPEVDAQGRFSTACNHTGLHLLNRAIREYYGSEECVSQVSSSVRPAGFKFEFAFNELYARPTAEDVAGIEAVLKELVRKDLPVRIAEDVQPDEANFRRLRDVLYPLKARAVQVGDSGELCCGTHAHSTGQLKEIVIRSFSPNGKPAQACYFPRSPTNLSFMIRRLVFRSRRVHRQSGRGGACQRPAREAAPGRDGRPSQPAQLRPSGQPAGLGRREPPAQQYRRALHPDRGRLQGQARLLHCPAGGQGRLGQVPAFKAAAAVSACRLLGPGAQRHRH